MFMRYRGGGVGHLYMRTIEAWLVKTGWGADDLQMPKSSDSDNDSDDSPKDGEGKDPGLDDEKGNSNKGSEDEVSDESGTSSNHTSSTDDVRDRDFPGGGTRLG